MVDDASSNNLSVDIQIANLFYEAEDLMRDQPTEALDKFREVVRLAQENADKINDESRTSQFSSLVHITVILIRTQRYEEMRAPYDQILSFLPRVTRNEGSEAIDSVLNALGNVQDFSLLEQVYRITAQQLSSLPDSEKMLFSVQMKLCRCYLARNDYAAAGSVLDTLHAMCKLRNGEDDKRNKGAELLEIYAARISISSATHDNLQMHALYEATRDLSAAVKDPRSQSVIRECWGRMFGEQGEWQRAYTEFYSAFCAFQELGQRERAKQCLQYVVIANMLAGGEQNPFDAREAKVYERDPDIQAIVGLRTAYEKVDVHQFQRCLNELQQKSRETRDTFIPTHLSSIQSDFQRHAIVAIVKSYRRLRIAYLAGILQLDVASVQRCLSGLILDGVVEARMDSVNGVIDLTSTKNENTNREDAKERWATSLGQMSKSVTTVG